MIIVRIWEGIGNQLFQYAFAKALSLRLHTEVYLDKERAFGRNLEEGYVERPYSLEFFNISLRNAQKEDVQPYSYLERRSILDKIRFWAGRHNLNRYSFFEEQKDAFMPTHISINRNCYIKGWFQNEKYFKKYRDILLKEFSLRNEVSLPGELRRILNNEETVSIHIRRGDYKKIGCSLPLRYYECAIEKIKEYCQKPYFIVFSDEIEWVMKHMQFGENVYYVNKDGNFKDYEELLLMSYCRNNIIANSTFSWWGAWLNQNSKKTVIAPKRWFLNRAVRDDECIVPKDWIRI